MPLLWPKVLREPFDIEHAISGQFADLGRFPLPPAIRSEPETGQLPPFLETNHCNLLRRQETKLQKDWEIVSREFPHSAFSDYVHNWLIVNTRSFYYEFPDAKNPPSFNDRMVLCPFVDCFNHQDHGVSHNFRMVDE